MDIKVEMGVELGAVEHKEVLYSVGLRNVGLSSVCLELGSSSTKRSYIVLA